MNTCIRCGHLPAATLQCARPCIRVIATKVLPAASRQPVRGTQARCAITQSISLSKNQKHLCVEIHSPEAWKPNQPAKLDKLTNLFPGRCPVCTGRPTGNSECDGGAERDRTVDPLLAKQVLSQLSYSPTCWNLRLRWWAWVDSNYRPHPYQGCALTN